jgi:Ca2+-binding EF-hand superfamily protein
MVGLTSKEKKNLKKVFDMFDKDGDGKITTKEITKVVHQLSEYHCFICFVSLL